MPATRTDKVIKQNRPYRLQTTTALMSLMRKEVEATSNEEVAEEVRRNADITGIRKGRHLVRWVRTYLKEKSKLGSIDSDVELAGFKITHKGHQQFQEIGKHIPAGLNELDWTIACLKEAKIHLGPFTRDEVASFIPAWTSANAIQVFYQISTLGTGETLPTERSAILDIDSAQWARSAKCSASRPYPFRRIELFAVLPQSRIYSSPACAPLCPTISPADANSTRSWLVCDAHRCSAFLLLPPVFPAA
ncbi:hypothetical protein C8R43DRAFT_1044064 [Mycena crocata]|nr:hypothetical protein C8R43DRAFT_1044064 [Mycena crocata]